MAANISHITNILNIRKNSFLYAIKRKNRRMARLWIGLGVHINTTDKKGDTALHIAVANNYKKYIKC